MKHVILPDSERHSLAFYLAMEEFVARKYEDEAFFVWRVEPTVIIGRNQDLEAEVNLQYCSDHGVHVVRRKSGGGCVYSDLGNIMISYVSRRGDVSAVFDRYLSELTACLVSLGLHAEKSGRNDILVDGRKVSGNAFHQMPDRSVVHGTLLYDTDMDALETAIRPPVEKLQRHGVPSVRQRVRNIVELVNKAGKIDNEAEERCEGKAFQYAENVKQTSQHLRSVEALEQYIVEYFTGWKSPFDMSGSEVLPGSEVNQDDKELRLTPEDVAEIDAMAADYIITLT
jgi:lipoic acid synthetase/lipoate-protein ligase A